MNANQNYIGNDFIKKFCCIKCFYFLAFLKQFLKQMFINDFFGHFNLEIVQDLELELWNGRCKKDHGLKVM